MDPTTYPEWQAAIERIVETGGLALLLGDTDTGKTTFTTLLTRAALAAGRRIAVVDADLGQSEIGPPTCVGMGLPSEAPRALSDIAPTALAFVGATSPRGRLLETATAVRVMADAARAQEPDLVVVDTTGFVRGPAAWRLKQAKTALLQPDHLVVLQRKAECEPLLAGYRHAESEQLMRLPVPAVIARKPAAYRAQRRAARLQRYFHGGEVRAYSLDEVSVVGGWLGSGAPVAPHLLRFLANTLHTRVFYAEQHERRLSLITSGRPNAEEAMALIQEQFRAESVAVTPAVKLHHLLVGLSDPGGRLLGVGLIETVDFRRRTLGVLTPVRAHAAVRRIDFGILRVKPDGAELEEIRPGEV